LELFTWTTIGQAHAFFKSFIYNVNDISQLAFPCCTTYLAQKLLEILCSFPLALTPNLTLPIAIN
jgi:hypothetical protein